MQYVHIPTRPRFGSRGTGLRTCRFKRVRLAGSSTSCVSLISAIRGLVRRFVAVGVVRTVQVLG